MPGQGDGGQDGEGGTGAGGGHQAGRSGPRRPKRPDLRACLKVRQKPADGTKVLLTGHWSGSRMRLCKEAVGLALYQGRVLTV